MSNKKNYACDLGLVGRIRYIKVVIHTVVEIVVITLTTIIGDAANNKTVNMFLS